MKPNNMDIYTLREKVAKTENIRKEMELYLVENTRTRSVLQFEVKNLTKENQQLKNEIKSNKLFDDLQQLTQLNSHLKAVIDQKANFEAKIDQNMDKISTDLHNLIYRFEKIQNYYKNEIFVHIKNLNCEHEILVQTNAQLKDQLLKTKTLIDCSQSSEIDDFNNAIQAVSYNGNEMQTIPEKLELINTMQQYINN